MSRSYDSSNLKSSEHLKKIKTNSVFNKTSIERPASGSGNQLINKRQSENRAKFASPEYNLVQRSQERVSQYGKNASLNFKDLMEFSLNSELEKAERNLLLVNVTQQVVSGKIKFNSAAKPNTGLLKQSTIPTHSLQ